jgi:hypothetical protein
MAPPLDGILYQGPDAVFKKVEVSLSTPRRRMAGGGTHPLIHNPGARWWVANFTPGRFGSPEVGSALECVGKQKISCRYRDPNLRLSNPEIVVIQITMQCMSVGHGKLSIQFAVWPLQRLTLGTFRLLLPTSANHLTCPAMLALPRHVSMCLHDLQGVTWTIYNWTPVAVYVTDYIY